MVSRIQLPGTGRQRQVNLLERGADAPLDHSRIEVVDPKMAELLRAKTLRQRLLMVRQVSRTAHKVLAMGVRLQHPSMTPTKVEADFYHAIPVQFYYCHRVVTHIAKRTGTVSIG
ncbi:MAG: hypothetical protein KDB01_22350 [Planctomycetaceae bacterium]|nr:hypothetical protein [Planctomycetaceae bacterium]